jgi:phosphatidylglycerophosphate synthase
MGIYTTKSKWQNFLQPAVNICVRRRLHPDVFTYGGLALSAIAAWSLLQAGSDLRWLWLAPVCVLGRLLCNLMDGLVARASGVADRWGEVKNEFGDRIADVAIFLGLGLGGYADARLAMPALTLILCVSYLGILGKAVGGSRVYGGVFGKGDRMMSLAAFTLYPAITGSLSSYNVYLCLAISLAAITLIQRLRILHRQTK